MKKMYRFLFVLLVLMPAALQAQDGYDSTQYETEEENYSTDDYEEPEENYTYQEGNYTPVEATSLEPAKEYKKEKIEVRKFDKKEWKEIVGSTDYNEKKKEKRQEEDVREETADDTEPLEINSPWSGAGLQTIFYILVIAVVGLILWAVFKNMSFDMKLKKTVTVTDDAVTDFEHIEELDIDTYLRKAREEKNYKLAIRLYYLGLLKRLNATGFIFWRKDKTNLDYLNEVFSRDFHYNDIRKLTLAYEEVWYGERNLTDESFHNVTSRFESMFGKINAQATS
jgi:hypothetical protein